MLALPTESLGAFVVGSVRHQIGEFEPTSGRIIMFDVVPSIGGQRELKKLAEAEANGCVYALATVGNAVAVAVNTSVRRLLRLFTSTRGTDLFCRSTCTFQCSTKARSH